MNKQTTLFTIIGLFLLMLPSTSFGQGSGYAGPYTTSAPIVLNGVSNRTISGLQITNPNGNCITLTNCSNIIIENCKLGPSKGEGISVQSSSNITIRHNTMESIRTGVYALSSSGLKVEYNDVKNVVGPMPRGQMVQLDKVNGAGISISYNVAENIAGQSAPEDVISMYQSNGTSASPIRVVGNWIRGGGPSTSGGGIMTGDGGGSYVHVEGNILVNPGQYGIAIAGGHHIVITKNKLYAEKLPWNNIGMYTWNQSSSVPSHSNTMSYNESNYINKNGVVNNFWNNGNMGEITGWSTNKSNSSLNASILPTKIIGTATTSSGSGITTDITQPTINNTGIKMYPNPVVDQLTIESEPRINNGSIIIYNVAGQRVAEQIIQNGSTQVNTAHLSVGVYLVRVSGNGKVLEDRKIMVVKK